VWLQTLVSVLVPVLVPVPVLVGAIDGAGPGAGTGVALAPCLPCCWTRRGTTSPGVLGLEFHYVFVYTRCRALLLDRLACERS